MSEVAINPDAVCSVNAPTDDPDDFVEVVTAAECYQVAESFDDVMRQLGEWEGYGS